MATKLDLAYAQFIGFFHGKWNFNDIIGLVIGMGLTKKEWLKLRNEYPVMIDESDIKEIDAYFRM